MSKYFPETAVNATELGKLVAAGAVEKWNRDQHGEQWYKSIDAADEKPILGIPSRTNHGVFQADDEIQADEPIDDEFPDDCQRDETGAKIYDAHQILADARARLKYAMMFGNSDDSELDDQ